MTNKKEEVNHPKRYSGECSLECIEVMKLIFGTEIVIWFCMCNAFKYMWRFKSKNGEEDLKKSDFYIRKWAEISGYPHNKLDNGYDEGYME